MFTVEDTFQISGRGTVVLIDGKTDLGMGKPHTAEVTCPDGTVFTATCYKERLLLRSQPVGNERECYLLMNIEKSKVPIGSKITFNEDK